MTSATPSATRAHSRALTLSGATKSSQYVHQMRALKIIARRHQTLSTLGSAVRLSRPPIACKSHLSQYIYLGRILRVLETLA